MNQRLVSVGAFLAAMSIPYSPVSAIDPLDPEADYLAANNALFDLPNDESPEIEAEIPEESPEPLDGLIQPEEAVDAPAGKETVQPRFRFQGRLRTGTTYDDNIFIQEKDKTSDLIFSVQPGFTIGAGDLDNRKQSFLLLDYDANATFFTDHSSLNSLDHNAALRGQWLGSKLTLGGILEFQKLTGTSAEVGERVNRNTYEAGIYARYQWSDRTRLETSLGHVATDYEDQIDSKEWKNRNWVDHQFGPRTELGVGITLGWLDVKGSGTQTYEQLLGRVKYAVGAKFYMTLSGGIEFRQFERGGSQTTPVFNLGATYSPYELVTFELETYRRVQPSITRAGQNTVVSGASGRVKYRFLQRFEAALTAGYERSDYDSNPGEKAASRKGDYAFVRANLDYTITERWKAGVFYEARKNDSNRRGSSFENQRAGVQVSFAF